jgi:hypothetical protein
MPRSYARRRRRLAPIRRLRRAARIGLAEVCEEAGVDLLDAEAERLVGNAVLFADPFPWRGRDALLPAHRWDLRREFFQRALELEDRSDAEMLAIAWNLAPSPDEHPRPGTLRWGADGPSYGEAAVAFEYARNNRIKITTT